MKVCCEVLEGPAGLREEFRDFKVGNETYTVQIADSIWTRMQSYRLMYETYAQKGWAKPHPSRMWYSAYELLGVQSY